MRSKATELYALEQLANRDDAMRRLHPLAKMLTTLAFIITVAAQGKTELPRLLVLLCYPALLAGMSGIPQNMIAKRAAVALPFCLLVGLPNVFLERQTALWINGLAVSEGLLGMVSLVLRVYLCVSAVLILVGNTPLRELTSQARRLRLPAALVAVFEMTYRYIGLAVEEANTMAVAYRLRAGRRGIQLRDAGSFIGQLLLRGFDRAERVYAAMRCRGYGGGSTGKEEKRRFVVRDWLYTVGICAALAGIGWYGK